MVRPHSLSLFRQAHRPADLTQATSLVAVCRGTRRHSGFDNKWMHACGCPTRDAANAASSFKLQVSAEAEAHIVMNWKMLAAAENWPDVLTSSPPPAGQYTRLMAAYTQRKEAGLQLRTPSDPHPSEVRLDEDVSIETLLGGGHESTVVGTKVLSSDVLGSAPQETGAKVGTVVKVEQVVQ